MEAGQLDGLGLAKGRVSMAIPGERFCLEQVETRAGNGPARGETVEGVPRLSVQRDEGQGSGLLKGHLEKGSEKGMGRAQLVKQGNCNHTALGGGQG